MSCVTCHVSCECVTCHILHVICHNNFFFFKLVKLFSIWSVMNRDYPIYFCNCSIWLSTFVNGRNKTMYNLKCTTYSWKQQFSIVWKFETALTDGSTVRNTWSKHWTFKNRTAQSPTIEQLYIALSNGWTVENTLAIIELLDIHCPTIGQLQK